MGLVEPWSSEMARSTQVKAGGAAAGSCWAGGLRRRRKQSSHADSGSADPRHFPQHLPRKPEASSSPSTSAIVDDGGGRRLAARGQQPVSIDERARPLDRSAAMHDPTSVSAPQRCDRPSTRSTQPPINTDLRSCRACTAVVVCIRQCQNPRSSSMQACRTKANLS